MQVSTRKAVLMRKEITSDISLIPSEDYLKVASMLLKLEPSDRRDDEIQALQKLTDELYFFKNINSKKANVRNKLHYKICSKMKYESSKKGHAIIEYGAKADKFFVLLKGSVIVYLTKSAEILQNEIQEEIQYQEEKSIPPLFLHVKDQNQNRANSIASSQSQSPNGKASFFKSNSILNTQGGALTPLGLKRGNTGFFQDSMQSPKRSITKNSVDSSSNFRFSGSDQILDSKDNNVIQNTQSDTSNPELRRGDSIKMFESINMDRDVLQLQKVSGEHGKSNDSDSNSSSAHKTSQQRFQRMFRLIKQRGKQLDSLLNIDDIKKSDQEKQSNADGGNNEDNNNNSNSISQHGGTMSGHRTSMFGKFSNAGAAQQSSSSENEQVSPLQSKLAKQLSFVNPFSSTSKEEQQQMEQDKQNEREEQLHLQSIRRRFCDKFMFSKIFGSLSAQEIEKPEKFIHFPSFVFKYYYQRTLESGSTFGELGLLDGKPRSALILCAEDCEFGVMEKEDYQELLGDIHRREIERKFNFLKDHMLPELTNQALKKIFYNFQKIKVQKNEYIFKQGALSDGIYLIKKGDIKLEKTLTYQEQLKDEGAKMMRKGQQIKKNTPFATLSSGEYFGEEFLIFDFKSKHYRSYSAVVSSIKSSMYFMQSSAFTEFLKQFPDLFLAFKNTVTFKIHRRQEYMHNIEHNYKEMMKQKEHINNQRQNDLKIIQQIQTQKSFTDLGSLSPVASPMMKRQQTIVLQQQQQNTLLKQISQSITDSPSISRFDYLQRINGNNVNEQRANLLSYCSPSSKLNNSSLIDFDFQSNNNSGNLSYQPQIKFQKLTSSQLQDNSTSKQLLQTLREEDQIQKEEDESQQKKQFQPQTRLIKLVSTLNNIQLPTQIQQNSKFNDIEETHSIIINKSNNPSPTQIVKMKLLSELQSEDLSPIQNSNQSPSTNKFYRNSIHSKTISCINYQGASLSQENNSQQFLQFSPKQNSNSPKSFMKRKDFSKSKTQIITQSPTSLSLQQQQQQQQQPYQWQYIASQTQSPKQQNHENHTPSKPNEVIRQERIENLVDFEDFLDIQYLQTQYNPQKLEELLKSAEETKSKQKSNNNILENRMEFLYDNGKEIGIRIGMIKQKIHNQYRIDLSHQNSDYIKNRQNIYSNSQVSKSVDKVTKISKHYQKKQDKYDQIIRSTIVQNRQPQTRENTEEGGGINTSCNQVEPKSPDQIRSQKKEEGKQKDMPEIFINKSIEHLHKSSSIESKYTNPNEKVTLDTAANSHNNLDCSSQMQISLNPPLSAISGDRTHLFSSQSNHKNNANSIQNVDQSLIIPINNTNINQSTNLNIPSTISFSRSNSKNQQNEYEQYLNIKPILNSASSNRQSSSPITPVNYSAISNNSFFGSLIPPKSPILSHQTSKLSKTPLKQQPQPESTSQKNEFNFNIIKLSTNVSCNEFTQTNNELPSLDQLNPSSLIDSQPQLLNNNKSSSLQKEDQTNNIKSDKKQLPLLQQQQQHVKYQNLSLQISPTNTQRRNLTSIGISRQQLQKPLFQIKQQIQVNSATKLNSSQSPLLKKSKQEQNLINLTQQNSTAESPLSTQKDDPKYASSFFFKHRKTQSQLVFNLVPSYQIQKQQQQVPPPQQSHQNQSNKSSFSTRFNNNPLPPNNQLQLATIGNNKSSIMDKNHLPKQSSMHNLSECLNSPHPNQIHLQQYNHPIQPHQYLLTSSSQDQIQFPSSVASPQQSLTAKSSVRQKYISKKLSSLIGISSLPADSNSYSKSSSTLQLHNTFSHKDNNLNNNILNTHLPTSTISTNETKDNKFITQIQNNSGSLTQLQSLQSRQSNRGQNSKKFPLKIFKGSTVNSSVNLRTVLDQASTNSPLLLNSGNISKKQITNQY